MPRKQSKRISEVQEQMEKHLSGSRYRPGDRFLSAREAAAEYGISYQTAHRLLSALCEKGLVERRLAAGTFIPGSGDTVDARSGYEAVQLFFDVRARRPGSFGARLLQELGQHLRRSHLSWEVVWTDDSKEAAPDCFPAIWQDARTLADCQEKGRPALLLNERPAPGLSATFLDSVSMDDYFGGVCAAQYLRQRSKGNGFAVLTGPADDPRSRDREAGFRSVIPSAALVCAGGWFREDGLRVAGEAIHWGESGLFCCNDRLAEAVLSWCGAYRLPCPPLIGFDNAPVSETLNLTTIAIPWDELISDAAAVIRQRLSGDTSAARQRIVTPSLVVRG
ncbi:MAG: substrate-binding domain-containing protein [Armatimonadota bacterium]